MSRLDNKKPIRNEGYLINEQIRDALVDVIDTEGTLHEGISSKVALELAREVGLDLVKVGEKEGRSVAKVMDFGKFLYSRKKKTMKSKKTQKVIQVKEIKMRPKIGPGDYETKLNAAERFLKEGKHVKFTLQFRGRQVLPTTELGQQFFGKLKDDLLSKDIGSLAEEKESRSGYLWSKIFYIKK